MKIKKERMNHITVKERSNYFRGLLLLISKDNKISEPEIILMKHIGKVLDFETDFCDKAISEILNNKYVLTEPPKFSTKELAKKFIKDGLTLADSDNEIHVFEETWLKNTAKKNGIDVEWFIREKENITGIKDYDTHLEVEGLKVDYSTLDTST